MDNFLSISVMLLWVFVLAQTAVIFVLVKFIVQFLNRFRIESGQKRMVAPGKVAPLFRETDSRGRQVTLAEFNNHHTLLLFSKDNCRVCRSLMPALPEMIAASRVPLRTIIIAPEQFEEEMPHPENESIHFLRSDVVVANYQLEEVPTFVLINPAGTIVDLYSNADLNKLQAALGIVEPGQVAS